jgi:ABC-type multidrug transport system fused ATPase/permease subunit
MVLYALYAGSGIGMLAEVYGEVMRAAGAADRAAEVLNAEPRDCATRRSTRCRCRQRSPARSPSIT